MRQFLADWADVPHPPTDEDGPVMVIHVLKYRDAADAAITPEQMEADTRTAAVTAGAHGGRVAGWFAAEGTILGDGRTWDQVRFNAFPSKAAFMAVVFDPARLEAQKGSAVTAALLRIHADRVATLDRQRRMAERFTSVHRSIKVATVPVMPSDVVDLDGLRLVGQALADRL